MRTRIFDFCAKRPRKGTSSGIITPWSDCSNAAYPASLQCHIVTVYRPDLEHFEADFKTRRRSR